MDQRGRARALHRLWAAGVDAVPSISGKGVLAGMNSSVQAPIWPAWWSRNIRASNKQACGVRYAGALASPSGVTVLTAVVVFRCPIRARAGIGAACFQVWRRPLISAMTGSTLWIDDWLVGNMYGEASTARDPSGVGPALGTPQPSREVNRLTPSRNSDLVSSPPLAAQSATRSSAAPRFTSA